MLQLPDAGLMSKLIGGIVVSPAASRAAGLRPSAPAGCRCVVLQISEDVVAVDTDHEEHQGDEQFVHGCFAELLVDLAADDSADDPAHNHEAEDQEIKFRNTAAHQRGNQAGGLGEQDDVQGVFSCQFCRHGEEEEQDHQIDGTAADTQEGGDHAQDQTDHRTDHLIGDVVCVDLIFFQGVDQCSQSYDQKAGGLDDGHAGGGSAHGTDDLEEVLSQNSADGCAQRQRNAGSLVDLGRSGQFILSEVVGGHGQYRTAGQEVDGGGIHDTEGIQSRFDDDSAADAADGTNGAGTEANEENEKMDHGWVPFGKSEFIYVI